MSQLFRYRLSSAAVILPSGVIVARRMRETIGGSERVQSVLEIEAFCFTIDKEASLLFRRQELTMQS